MEKTLDTLEYIKENKERYKDQLTIPVLFRHDEAQIIIEALELYQQSDPQVDILRGRVDWLEDEVYRLKEGSP